MSTARDPETPRTRQTSPPAYQDADMTEILPIRAEDRTSDPTAPGTVPTTEPATPAHDSGDTPPDRAAGPAGIPPAVPAPSYRTGPAPVALVIGLLGLVLAVSVLLTEVTELGVPWDDVGPWSVVVAGAVILLVGTLGLRSSRSRG
ncbi:MAG: hypothetical protein ACRCZD_18805 [Phycicoccus sp.]